MFIPHHSGYRAGPYARSIVGGYRHLLTTFLFSVLELEPGDFSRQYDPSDWKEYFCVLEREPPAIRICLDEQVSAFTALNIVKLASVWSSFMVGDLSKISRSYKHHIANYLASLDHLNTRI